MERITPKHNAGSFRTRKNRKAKKKKNLNLKNWFQSKTKPQNID
jgi:hypothetical protein